MKKSSGTVKATNDAMSSSNVMRNVIASFGQFFVRFLIGIWFTRFLIQTLGTEMYSLVPLAWNITNYLALITLIMNAPSARYLIIEMSRNNLDSANNIFNTVFWGLSGLSLIILIVGTAVSWYSPFLFKVPAGHETDARFIFLAVSGAFVITTFSNPLSLSTYVTNRLDLRSVNETLQLVIRIGIAFSLISFFGWKLGAVSTGIILSTAIGLVITGIMWRLLTPELVIGKPRINIPILKEISRTGGWMLVSQLGTLMFLHAELIIVNLLYGAYSTGRYGALLVLPTVFRSVAQMISSTLSPPVMDRYGKNDIDGIVRFLCRSTRLLGLLMALPLGLLCGFSVHILTIWLGKEFMDLSPLLIVLSAHLCVNLAILPIFSLNVMSKRVKIPGLVTLVMGVMNVILAILLGYPEFGLGLIGIAIAGAIVLTMKNAVFTPLYGAHILNKNKLLFYPSMAAGVIGFLIVVGCSYFYSKAIEIANIYDLLTGFTGVSLLYIVIIWLFVLNAEDKIWMQNRIQLSKNTR